MKYALIETISKVHVASRGIYGSPRVFKALKAVGSMISKATVEQVMRENKLKARGSKKYKETTDSKHSNPVADNIAARAFEPGVPNKLWCADITCLWTDKAGSIWQLFLMPEPVIGMRCSMSRIGNCWDNAVMESFFHSLKVEWVYQTRYKTRAAARFSIFEYIEVFYNRQRTHSTLGYVTPECYERRLLSKCA